LPRNGDPVANFRYRALTQAGEVVSGSISAPTAAEVARRIEYLGLVPIESVTEGSAVAASGLGGAFFNRPRAEDVTAFTRDLALLLKAGARFDHALELLAGDAEFGRLRQIAATVRTGVLAGESFAEVTARHPTLFPAVYVALVRVGESSGALANILEVVAVERGRAEALRRKLTDALHYPAFILLSAIGVLTFFLLFVLPQFSTTLRDFGAKTDSTIEWFLGLSDFLREHGGLLAVGTVGGLAAGFFALRRPALRSSLISEISRLPFISGLFNTYRAALFCRNLGILLGADVTLTATLRILTDIMAATGRGAVWLATADRVRQGGKLSDALAASALLPAMAIRLVRLGEESGQLPATAMRIAEFYEAKLQRNLDRIVAVIGPLAILVIGGIVGGLIVSIMTALLSISQVIG
jgi:general secretion pathway protein F